MKSFFLEFCASFCSQGRVGRQSGVCGRVKIETFLFLLFFYCHIVINDQFDANPCDETSSGLVCALSYRYFDCFGILEPQLHNFVLFRPQDGLFWTLKTLRLKGRFANCGANHIINLVQKATRTNGFIFTHVGGEGICVH